MTAAGVLNPNSQMKDYGREDWYIAPKPSLREELEIALEAAKGKQRNALAYDLGDMWADGWELQREIEEQLTLLDAIEYGYILPVLGQG